MMVTQVGTADILEELSFWRHLSKEERELVHNRQQLILYRAGQHLCGGSSNCLGLVVVVQGVLRTYLLSPDGREITLYRTREGESCVMSAACVLNALSFDTYVEAETDCRIMLIPIDVYSALINENVHVECDSYKTAMSRFADVVAGVERLVFFSVEQRLASFLLDESAESGSDTISMTHEQMAVSIASAREVVSRTLKGMSANGWVELFRGGVRLLDKVALYRLVES